MAVGLLLIAFFFLQLDHSKNSTLHLAGLTLVAIILDILWLIFYQSKFWNTDYIDSGTFNFGRRYEVIVQYILLIVKVLVLLLLYRLFRMEERSKYRFMSQPTPPFGIPMGYLPPGNNPYTVAQPPGFYRPTGVSNWTGTGNEGFFLEPPGASSVGYGNSLGPAPNPTGPAALPQGSPLPPGPVPLGQAPQGMVPR